MEKKTIQWGIKRNLWLIFVFLQDFISLSMARNIFPGHHITHWPILLELLKRPKKNYSEHHTKQFVLFSVLQSGCLSAVSVQADQSPVVAAPPVCVFERAGLYWERPSNSLMYRLVRSPPCCRPPGSAAPPSPSWELKVTGGRKHGFRIKMMNMSCLSKV